jgi:hypothetical protein
VPEAVNVLTAYVMPPDVYVVDVPPLIAANFPAAGALGFDVRVETRLIAI